MELPGWFEALNSDLRCRLACIGGFAPVYIYIAEEITHNRSKIAGWHARLKVSWRVSGIRQSAVAKAYRIQMEEDKPAIEKGFYLHPEVFGQTEEKGIEWAHRRDQMCAPQERQGAR